MYRYMISYKVQFNTLPEVQGKIFASTPFAAQQHFLFGDEYFVGPKPQSQDQFDEEWDWHQQIFVPIDKAWLY